MRGAPLGEPAATALREVTSGLDEAAIDAAESGEELDAAYAVTGTTVTFSSYGSEGEAAAVLKALKGGIGACDGGFASGTEGTANAGGVSAASAPEAGDDAVAFTVAPGGDDLRLQGLTRAVVLRRGSVIAQFGAENPAALVSTDDRYFPAVLVETRDVKLTRPSGT